MTTPLSYGTAEYYRESGRLNLIRTFICLVVGLAVLSVASWLYAYADLYGQRLSIFKLALPFVYGLSCGAVVGLLVQIAHIRIASLRTLIIFCLSAGALYLSWCFWLYDLLHSQPGPGSQVTLRTFLFHPNFSWALIRFLAGLRPVGTTLPLPVRWSLEAVIILACTYFLARALNTGPSYCENCGSWTKSGVRLVTLPVTDIPTLRSQLESGDFVTMIAMSRVRASASVWLEAWTYSCKHCKSFHTLSVKPAKSAQGGLRLPRRIGRINHLVISTIDLEAMNAIRAEHRRNRAAAPLAGALADDDGNFADETEASDQPASDV